MEAEDEKAKLCSHALGPPPMLGMGDRAPYPSWKSMRKSQRVAHACTSGGVCIESCNLWRSLGDAQSPGEVKRKTPRKVYCPIDKNLRGTTFSHAKQGSDQHTWRYLKGYLRVQQPRQTRLPRCTHSSSQPGLPE